MKIDEGWSLGMREIGVLSLCRTFESKGKEFIYNVTHNYRHRIRWLITMLYNIRYINNNTSKKATQKHQFPKPKTKINIKKSNIKIMNIINNKNKNYEHNK